MKWQPLALIAGGAALVAGFPLSMPLVAFAGLAVMVVAGISLGLNKARTIEVKSDGLDSFGRSRLMRLEKAKERLKTLSQKEGLTSPVAMAALEEAEMIMMEARRILEKRPALTEVTRRRSLLEHEIKTAGSDSLREAKQKQLTQVTAAEQAVEQIEMTLMSAESEMIALATTLEVSVTSELDAETHDLRNMVDRLKSLSQVVEETDTMLEQRA